MIQPSLRWKNGTLLVSGFFLFEAAWSCAFVVLTVLTPSLPENAVWLGLSSPRLAMAGLFLATAAASLMALAISRRKGDQSGAELSAAVRPIGLWTSLVAILVGAALLVVYATAAGAFPASAIARLAPLGLWLLISGVALGGVLIVGMGRPRGPLVGQFGLMLAIGLAGVFIHSQVWPASESGSSDIYYTFQEGQRIARGENPYERVLAYDVQQNIKFPHNLPFFYYLAAAVIGLGLSHFGTWIAAWRMIFLFANLSIALAVFQAYWRAELGALGVVGASLWLFNRWTLHVSQSGDIDILALSFLVASAVLLGKRRRLSMVLFGASIAIRHLALALAPIWLISANRSMPFRRWMTDGLLVALTPVLTSLPLFLSNPQALLQAVLLPWTRPSEASGQVESLNALLGVSGIPALIFILALLSVIILAVGRARLGPSTASMLSLATVVSFTSVFYTSYLVWLMPFLPLAALEAVQRSGPAELKPPGSPAG